MARYALVIGIQEYDSPHLNLLSKSVNDAEDFAKLLEEYGDCPKNHIDLLTGRVDSVKLVEAFQTFLNEKAQNQEAIIYFSGHGVLETKVDRLTDETDKEGYLAASDCEIGKNRDRYEVKENGLKLASIQKLIQRNQLTNLIFILDACHSGFLIEEIKNSFNGFDDKTTYYFLAACQPYELSWARKTNRHSEFTGALLKALSQEHADSNGIITVGEAFERASKSLQQGRQEPIFLGKGISLRLLKYPNGVFFVPKQFLKISDDRLVTLREILREIESETLTSSARDYISKNFPQALIHRPKLQSDKALDLEQILRLLQTDFPFQPDRTPSLLAWVRQLIISPQSENQEKLFDWFQQVSREVISLEALEKQQPKTCQAYLLVIIEPQDKIYALRGILYQDEREPQQLSFSSQDDRATDLSAGNCAIASCEFEEIPQTLQKFLTLAQDRHLQGKPYDLTIELLLPFKHLAETVDLWHVCDPLGDSRPLAKDYRIVVRSYERFQHNQFRNKFLLGWRRWQNWKNHPELLTTKVEYLEGECDLDCDGLEANLSDKIALTCTLPPAQCDRDSLFKTLIRTGTPLALWSRCCKFDCAREFQQFLAPEMLENCQNLVEQLYQQRRTAHLNPPSETHWIYHVVAWLDNPDRMPINHLKTFGGS